MRAGKFSISTSKQFEFIDITKNIEKILESQQKCGMIFLFNPHTTAGLTVNEGADPDVQKDILAGLQSMVPDISYRHSEGNSRAHIMASLIGCSLTLAFDGKKLLLGVWQRIFFCEFDGPRTRTIHYRFNEN